MAGREYAREQGTAGADADAGWAQELLEHLRPAGRGPHRVAAWLAGAAHAEVTLQDGAGHLLAGTRAALDAGLVADITTGRIASAALEERGRHLRLVRVERPHPAPLLMVEDTVSARRVAAGLWPGLLDTETACVYVVESDPRERDRLAEECLSAAGERALVVRCPAMNGHVIVLAPRDTAGRELRTLVRGLPGVFLGGSSRQSLARTAAAYGQAVSALAVARYRPEQTAVYAERTRPERLMDPAALRDWTARVLDPLDSLPHHTRAELLGTTRLGLEFTAVATAKILGVSRNTVRARMDRVESLLRTDFTGLTVRAVVHLALNAEVGLAETPRPDPARGTARLSDLLSGPALRTWSAELLGRLDPDGRDLRRTLRTWIAVGGNAERAAQRLGMHAQTVREHVRSAEPVLERQLLASGGDLYEVVLAHLVAGDLDRPPLPGTKPGHPDSPVHG
ncbi:helix-turn-helix domain-containing protein [Streptomyces sp. FXJ7.023]|uniref:helix-turn-helix domain-containing protein n=1 Tax=Streptomyces sp. FXJ7.023 TaxID=579932 RepID=UPI0003A04057|nr:helix-turn-helix domain-containing protein [Streptomyces sp. FXJ7.023]